MQDFRMRPGPAYCPTQGVCFKATLGRGHRFYTGAPTWPYGFGLTYSRFHTTLQLRGMSSLLECSASGSRCTTSLGEVRRAFTAKSHAPHAADVVALVNARVANVGERASDHVSLLFAAPPDAGRGGTLRQLLVGFERRRLTPGGVADVAFDIRASALALAGADGVFQVAAGVWNLFVDNDPSGCAELRLA